jgi:hypothetical protein
VIKLWKIALPIPRLPPVTTTVFFSAVRGRKRWRYAGIGGLVVSKDWERHVEGNTK